MLGMDATDVDGFKVALADPTTGSCSYAQSAADIPVKDEACTVQGMVAFNIDNWFADSADWVLYCNTMNVWDSVARAKKKSSWELVGTEDEPGDFDKAWVRIDVDTENKKDTPPTPDNPTSWLKGEATGVTQLNTKCTVDPDATSDWAHGGSLHICIHGLTNQETFIGYICSRGVEEDTPNCNGAVGLNDHLVDSADCPLKPVS